MNHAREQHTASLLRNGIVLITGGRGHSDTFNSTELYNPLTGLWTTTHSMNDARSSHTVSVLQNGNVLVTGGISDVSTLKSAEIYQTN
ncbi:unnamed protein product [Adineta steineri]|nr:unnamed protein product [Adineta steineri]